METKLQSRQEAHPLRFDPTYEAWKHCSEVRCRLLNSSFDPTYEAWKLVIRSTTRYPSIEGFDPTYEAWKPSLRI